MSEHRHRGRILLAKTALDGHWRGINMVARGLRDAKFEVIFLGSATAEQIVAAAVDEDVDLVGLNVGGRIEVVERVIAALRATRPELPIFMGGTVSPPDSARLEADGIPVFPPGSAIGDLVAVATRLVMSTPEEYD